MHESYMKRALELALGGWGTTNPNPLVGAVIVKDGWIIGEGYHIKPGGNHAEVAALKNSTQDVRGATLYVNLEPCSHFGRTPPCVNAIIEAGISRVVIGMKDPNPLVAGKGVEILRASGIETEVGVLERESKKINEIFIKYITQRKPFVIQKTAMSLDGKICTAAGESKWISSEESRKYVHHLRSRVSAVMVGTNTVIKDNPSLTARAEGAVRSPARIVLDRTGRIPMDSKVFDNTGADVIAVVSEQVSRERIARLEEMGVKVVVAAEVDNQLDLCELVDKLYALELDSILLEGGGQLNFSALKAGVVDKVMIFAAPLILGGKEALTPVEGEGWNHIPEAVRLKNVSTRMIGNDILIEGYTSDLFGSDKGDECVYGHCPGNGCCKKH